MSEPFIAEIRIFAGNFAPRGWAFCDGQLLPLFQNSALYSLIGTIYGGDGHRTTALPNLQGRAPLHPGDGPGLTVRKLGQRGGEESVTLTVEQIPQHSHTLGGSTAGDNDYNTPANDRIWGVGETMYGAPNNLQPLGAVSSSAGGSYPHNNLQPYLTLNFIIALSGIYPSRA